MHSLTQSMPAMLDATAASHDAQLERSQVEMAKNGDRDAFSLLIERHQHRVFRLAGRFFRRPEDVEEVAQETFLTAWRKLGSYRGEAPFEHWLTRVCLNTSYMRLRRTKPTEQLPVDVPARHSSPEARLDAERLLAHLPSKDRFLLLLLHGEGWTVAEIAAKTGWSQSNVKVRAFRARRQLRRLMGSEQGGGA